MAANLTVVPFPVPSFADLPACLRRMADELEAAKRMPTSLIIIEEHLDGSLHCRSFGHNLMRAHIVGMMHMAALKTATQDWDEEDADAE